MEDINKCAAASVSWETIDNKCTPFGLTETFYSHSKDILTFNNCHWVNVACKLLLTSRIHKF